MWVGALRKKKWPKLGRQTAKNFSSLRKKESPLYLSQRVRALLDEQRSDTSLGSWLYGHQCHLLLQENNNSMGISFLWV